MGDYATSLRDHTALTCRSVDRVFLQAWVPADCGTGNGRAEKRERRARPPVPHHREPNSGHDRLGDGHPVDAIHEVEGVDVRRAPQHNSEAERPRPPLVEPHPVEK